MGDPNCASGGCWCGGQSSTSKIAPPVVTVPVSEKQWLAELFAPGPYSVSRDLLDELLAAVRLTQSHHAADCNKWRHHRPDFDCDCATARLMDAAAAVRAALNKEGQ